MMTSTSDMIICENVSKTFPDGTRAVKDFSVRVQEGETLVLLGTSGSGKTTAMKMINRLIPPSGGHIRVNGQDVMSCDPIQLRRTIGYAIQHIGLFPHMTVAENIATVPRLLKWSQKDIATRCNMLLEMVGLDPDIFSHRYPHHLSGGQRQRVGVARALAADPPIILMDEPFGALDPITREQLQNEFLSLESDLKKTIIFVTHDIFEAVKMGDRIALMDAGTIQQLASPRTLVEKPASAFVEDFLGTHRFQLSLLTQSIRPYVTENAPHSGTDTDTQSASVLTLSMSLIDALDMFKKTNASYLCVKEKTVAKGYLTRDILLTAIADVISSHADNV